METTGEVSSVEQKNLYNALLGAVHKLRRQAMGRGVCQMSMILHKLM